MLKFKHLMWIFLVLGLTACGNSGGDAGGQQGGTQDKPQGGEQAADGGQQGGAAAADGAADGKAEPGSLVIYSARGEKNVGQIIERFQKETGVKVDVRYGDATGLVTRLRAEGANADADVFFAQDVGNLGALRDSGLLAELPEALTSQAIEPFREPSRTWVPTSGRVRVLVYNPQKLKPEELPQSLKELPDPKWKGRFGWAPRNGSFQVHISALRAIWGEEATEKWLTDLKALEPAEYPKNSPQVQAVDKGEIDLGWVNHYYLHTLKATNPELVAANFSFPTDGDAGNLVMLSGVGVLKAARNKANAEKFANFLMSEAAQAYFAQETFEYPTRAGVPTHKDVPALETLKLAKVDPQKLTDLEPTRVLLQKLGLL